MQIFGIWEPVHLENCPEFTGGVFAPAQKELKTEMDFLRNCPERTGARIFGEYRRQPSAAGHKKRLREFRQGAQPQANEPRQP